MLLKYFISIFCLVLSFSTYAKTPKQMTDNVLALTEAAAILNVCFESPAYKKLSTEKALKIHDLTFRLTNLVEKIAEHYNDEPLYLTFEMMRVNISSDQEMKDYVKTKYNYCNDSLSTEMEAYVSENEKAINKFLTRQ